MTGPDDISKGFGFVNFSSPSDAAKAVQEMNGFEENGKVLFVCRALKKSEREAELSQKLEQLKFSNSSKYQGVNIYVKNLEEDVDETRLQKEFSQFGRITSCKVMRDERDVSRGFGFVCFATPEEANKAALEMNGKMLGNKPLYVALAQKKEFRKAQLEAQFNQRQNIGMVTPLYASGNAPPMFYPPQGFVYPQQMLTRGRWGPPPQVAQYPVPNYMLQVPQQPGIPIRQNINRRGNWNAGRGVRELHQ